MKEDVSWRRHQGRVLAGDPWGEEAWRRHAGRIKEKSHGGGIKAES